MARISTSASVREYHQTLEAEPLQFEILAGVDSEEVSALVARLESAEQPENLAEPHQLHIHISHTPWGKVRVKEKGYDRQDRCRSARYGKWQTLVSRMRRRRGPASILYLLHRRISGFVDHTKNQSFNDVCDVMSFGEQMCGCANQ
jgi:hypothetical protein